MMVQQDNEIKSLRETAEQRDKKIKDLKETVEKQKTKIEGLKKSGKTGQQATNLTSREDEMTYFKEIADYVQNWIRLASYDAKLAEHLLIHLANEMHEHWESYVDNPMKLATKVSKTMWTVLLRL